MSRLNEMRRFYDALAALADATGFVKLADWPGRRNPPARGVYFFFEEGEQRRESGAGPRVVRVGTHGLRLGSRSTLAARLKQHRGTAASGGGHHRGSVFRLHVGRCIADRRPELSVPTWAVGTTARPDVRAGERALEQQVSLVIRAMSVVCLPMEDLPGPTSLRGYVERNAIGLLSNLGRPPLDLPSQTWLGRCSSSAEIRGSGLWNVNHVREVHEPAFVKRFAEMVERIVARSDS